MLDRFRCPVVFSLQGFEIDFESRLYAHISTGAVYMFLSRGAGYSLRQGQQHLTPIPMINRCILIQKGIVETPEFWTFTDTNFKVYMKKIA